ncbi:HEAT repeat domain-containing protein [Lusitaniella coriacea LEGE 07157]|uniref:HEAT repeat domain-containing protein n=1 Tax=Lusitaniella coriacea LEGE 07157 TaxID=945747 RepID=A0A8J7DVA2_9CYAN|nr:HEAT repeat domain-containing protein [Lusitaniella coriacea]MBE9115656.1 HEAT repeat domain-containing protein [Lusitaniella coriacea LEGE 07157]
MTEATTIKELIQAVDRADSADELLDAVENLSEKKHKDAIPTLIEVLGFNNPGAAVAAVEGLIEIGEPVVPILLEQLDGYNYGARAWATRVFAGIGDPRALDLLLSAASSDFSLSVRRAAAKGLGIIRWSKLPEQEILPAQTQVLKTLFQVSEDPEWVVRYAAVLGLQSLALIVPNFKAEVVEFLKKLGNNDAELAIRSRVQMALNVLVQ